MRTRTVIGLIIFTLGTQAQLHAQDIIHCTQMQGPKTHVIRKSVRISTDGQGGYLYHASVCRPFPGCAGFCDYEESGPIEREYYNGFPTLRFENDEVEIKPFLGGTSLFKDEKHGQTFVFLKDECIVLND